MAKFLVILTLTATAVITGLHCAHSDPLTAEERNWLKEHDTVKVGAFEDYPPFGFLDKAGDAEGISVDYWMRLADKIGFRVQFQPMALARQLESLKKGEVDSLAGIFPLKERETDFDFSQPFTKINTYIYTNISNQNIQGFQDLKGLKVGAVKADSGAILAKEAGLSPREFPSYIEMVTALGKGEVDAIVLDELVAKFEISRQKLTDKIRRVDKPVYTGKMTLPVKKGGMVLLGILNKGVEAISKQEYEAIASKWLKWD